MTNHNSVEEWAREAENQLSRARTRRTEAKRWQWVEPAVITTIAFLFLAALAVAIIIAIRGGAL